MIEKLITLLIRFDIKLHKYTHKQWTIHDGYIVCIFDRNKFNLKSVNNTR